MATKKKRTKVSGRNKFPGVLVRPNREGQLERWQANAAEAKMKFSDWVRKLLDDGCRK